MTEFQCSLKSTQKHTAGPYHELDRVDNLITYFLKIHFSIMLMHVQVSQMVSSFHVLEQIFNMHVSSLSYVSYVPLI
jgi:hypothetical protein